MWVFFVAIDPIAIATAVDRSIEPTRGVWFLSRSIDIATSGQIDIDIELAIDIDIDIDRSSSRSIDRDIDRQSSDVARATAREYPVDVDGGRDPRQCATTPDDDGRRRASIRTNDRTRAYLTTTRRRGTPRARAVDDDDDDDDDGDGDASAVARDRSRAWRGARRAARGDGRRATGRARYVRCDALTMRRS